MNRISLSLLVALFTIGISSCQETEVKTIKPILLDKSVLSGVGLQKIDIKDEPEKDFYQKNLYRGEDLSVYVVSTESWINKMEDFPFDEFIFMYHGQAEVRPKLGESQMFNAGEYFFAPKGFTGEWEILAGTNLHYELSVISTPRANKSKIKKDQTHLLLDKVSLSGVDIDLTSDYTFTEVMVEGAELRISLCAEKPRKQKLIEPQKEKLIRLLAGQLKLSDGQGNEEMFYTGDFLIIPKGFTGEWESDGHGIVKWLVVEMVK